MKAEEIEKRIQESIKQNQIRNSQYVEIPLILNSYQLSNVLRAVRLSENSGDWYHEVLGKIDYQLRAFDLCLDEYDSKEKYIKPYIGEANLPYPENWKTYNGKNPTIKAENND